MHKGLAKLKRRIDERAVSIDGWEKFQVMMDGHGEGMLEVVLAAEGYLANPDGANYEALKTAMRTLKEATK
jgi:hypothetical protein